MAYAFVINSPNHIMSLTINLVLKGVKYAVCFCYGLLYSVHVAI